MIFKAIANWANKPFNSERNMWATRDKRSRFEMVVAMIAQHSELWQASSPRYGGTYYQCSVDWGTLKSFFSSFNIIGDWSDSAFEEIAYRLVMTAISIPDGTFLRIVMTPSRPNGSDVQSLGRLATHLPTKEGEFDFNTILSRYDVAFRKTEKLPRPEWVAKYRD